MATDKTADFTMGVNFVGVFLGIRDRNDVDRQTGEVKGKIFEVGVKTYSSDGFGGQAEKTTVLRLSKKQVLAGTGIYAQFENRLCCVPLNVMKWSNGKGETLFLGNGNIVPLQ